MPQFRSKGKGRKRKVYPISNNSGKHRQMTIASVLEVAKTKPQPQITQKSSLGTNPQIVQCPRDNHVFEPVISKGEHTAWNAETKSFDSYTTKMIWCDKCGASFFFNPKNGKWETSDGSLRQPLKLVGSETWAGPSNYQYTLLNSYYDDKKDEWKWAVRAHDLTNNKFERLEIREKELLQGNYGHEKTDLGTVTGHRGANGAYI